MEHSVAWNHKRGVGLYGFVIIFSLQIFIEGTFVYKGIICVLKVQDPPSPQSIVTIPHSDSQEPTVHCVPLQVHCAPYPPCSYTPALLSSILESVFLYSFLHLSSWDTGFFVYILHVSDIISQLSFTFCLLHLASSPPSLSKVFTLPQISKEK